jgi:hypothetical protein
MSITFSHTGKKGRMLCRVLLIAAVGIISLSGMSIWQAYRLQVATAADRQRPPVQGVVTAPVVGEYDVDPRTATFVFRGSVNMSAVEGWIAIDVLKDPTADPTDEQNWQYDVGFAEITGSEPVFTFESAPLQLFNLPGLTPWINGGLGRARVAFVFRQDPSQWVLLSVRDSDRITPENEHVIVFADINPDRTDQGRVEDPAHPSGFRCVPQDLDNVKDPTNPCTPDYLSANRHVLFFPPGHEAEQQQATTNYYRQIQTGPRGTGDSIEAALPTLQKFRERYFPPVFECNSLLNEPEAVTTYFNRGDLGIGREMHCINNGCTAELACYVMNFVGGSDGTPLFGDKAEAQAAVEKRKPFATVAMVERQNILGFPNSVFFVVYEHIGGDLNNTQLGKKAQLDRKAYNTSIPGNCLQCHGINSTYTAHADHEVRRAIFLPFDLDSFEFFSDDRNSALSRVRQEAAFRAQNRMVRSFSRLFQLADARRLIAGWYGDDLFAGTFNGSFVPPEWSGTEQQQQLYQKVYARACRTCHISYEPAPQSPDEFGDSREGLQFGTYQQFLTFWPLIKVRACGSIKDSEWEEDFLRGSLSMPNAEQTLREFWSTSARAHLFAQVPNAFGDCALPPPHLSDRR